MSQLQEVLRDGLSVTDLEVQFVLRKSFLRNPLKAARQLVAQVEKMVTAAAIGPVAITAGRFASSRQGFVTVRWTADVPRTARIRDFLYQADGGRDVRFDGVNSGITPDL